MLIKKIEDLIGNTPLVLLDTVNKSRIFLKLEGQNLSGSIKDRAAFSIIEDFKKRGLLSAETTLVEGTSGNTGIALAAIGAFMKLKVVIFMPENMTKSRIDLMRFYGADVRLTPASEGMKGATSRAQELSKTPGYLLADQFNNIANIEGHLKTAEEIFKDLPTTSIVVAGVGTGGTIMGLATYLKALLPNVKIVGVEPFESQVLNSKSPGTHSIQGIGANFFPPLFQSTMIDFIIPIKSGDALKEAKAVGTNYGISIGISSGASLKAAIEIALKLKNPQDIVVICPDSFSKYIGEN